MTARSQKPNFFFHVRNRIKDQINKKFRPKLISAHSLSTEKFLNLFDVECVRELNRTGNFTEAKTALIKHYQDRKIPCWPEPAGMINDLRLNLEKIQEEELLQWAGSILNYRFIPEAVREQITQWRNIVTSSEDKEKVKSLEQKIKKVNRLINGLTVKLHRELREDDTTFVSRTTLESTRYRPQNIVVLRAVLVNPLTDKKVLREITETQNRIGLQIWKEFESAYLRIRDEPD